MKRVRSGWLRRPRRRKGVAKGDDGSDRRAKILFWAQVLGAAAAVLVILFPVGRFLVSTAEDVFGDDDGWIEVSEANVVNGPQFSTMIGDRFIQTADSAPAIDVTVRNGGEDPVLLTEARLTIEDSARLPGCLLQGGGEVPVSPPHAVFLPLLPLPSERVRHRRLHEEVPAGGFDRFVLQFGVPPDGESDHLYALHVELLASQPEQTVDVGRFVLGVPASPGRGGVTLPESNDQLKNLSAPYERSYRLSVVWCLHRNLAGVRRLLSGPAERSPDLTALANLSIASSWPHYERLRSPRESVPPLLRRTSGEGPVLAVFAAEQTGDTEFVEATRKHAARIEIEQARKNMEHEIFLTAALDTRFALILDPSPGARDLWRRAEAALRGQEKEHEEEA